MEHDPVWNILSLQNQGRLCGNRPFDSSCIPVSNNHMMNISRASYIVQYLRIWFSLVLQKHDVAAEMIEVIYISHNSEDIEIKFGV